MFHFKEWPLPDGSVKIFYQGYYFLRKFWDTKYNGSSFNPWARNPNNFTVLRYADVLLLKAEALNESAGPTLEAYNLVNQIRTRAGESLVPEGLNKDAFREYIFDERCRELVGENHRFFDLKRRGLVYFKEKISVRLGRPIEDKHFYMPIPQGEIDINPALTQTPGWE